MGSSRTLPPGGVVGPTDGGGRGGSRAESMIRSASLAPHRRTARRVGQAIGVGTTAVCLSGCSWVSGMFTDDGPPTEEVSVFDIAVGQCFAAQQEVDHELSSLDAVPCDTPHQQEAYSIVDYQPPPGVEGDAFPGDASLAAYADAVCAQNFEDYVGISYLDSSLFFTYLLPSARGWEQSEDRAGHLLRHHHRCGADRFGEGVST